MSRSLMRAARNGSRAGTISFGDLIVELGDRSFGWSVLVFALINLLPLPLGSQLVTAIPLILLTAQMAFGAEYLRLPEFITRRPFDRRSFQKTVLRMAPLIRPIERIIRPRSTWVFEPESQRFVGMILLVVSVALFAPLPFSGWLPAAALLISAIGLIERDGAVTLLGLAVGIVAILVTLTVGLVIVTGFGKLLGS
jgi:hypothetical protein